MPPKGSGPKRSSPSVESLQECICQEVDHSIAAGAFDLLTFTPLNLDEIRRLPTKVLSAHVSSIIFQQHLVSFPLCLHQH